MKSFRVGLLLFSAALSLLVCSGAECYAQKTGQDAGARSQDMTLLERFAFKTNAFEWLLTIPNFTAEFDVTKSQYNKYTVSLTTKYNWNTYHSQAPSFVFNMFDIRPEGRWYFTTKPISRPSDAAKLEKWKNERAARSTAAKIEDFIRERRNPNPALVHYLGAYLNYGNYSYLINAKGIQGGAVGLGVSYGVAFQLYEYEKGSIDVEFGASAGLYVAGNQRYTYDDDSYSYKQVASPKNRIRFVPYPVISEIRAVFAYRTRSVRYKYHKENPENAALSRIISDVKVSFAAVSRDDFDSSKDVVRLPASVDDLNEDLTVYAKYFHYLEDPERYRNDFVKYIEEAVNAELKKNTPDRRPELSEKNLDKVVSLIRKLGDEKIAEFDKAMVAEGRLIQSRDDKPATAEKSSKADKPEKAVKDKDPKPEKEPKARKQKTEDENEQ